MPVFGKQRQVDLCNKVSLVYKMSSRTARDTQRKPFLKKQNNAKLNKTSLTGLES